MMPSQRTVAPDEGFVRTLARDAELHRGRDFEGGSLGAGWAVLCVGARGKEIVGRDDGKIASTSVDCVPLAIAARVNPCATKAAQRARGAVPKRCGGDKVAFFIFDSCISLSRGSPISGHRLIELLLVCDNLGEKSARSPDFTTKIGGDRELIA